VAVRHRSSAPLRRRISLALAVVSLLPLVLMGGGAWVVFGRLLEDRAVDLQRQVVGSHARSIESYLERQRELLRLLAETHRRSDLVGPPEMRSLFAALDRASDGAFVDLGVIDGDGGHLAYLGPYDLADRNYKEAAWFAEVMARGSYISDVFLGYRNVPHMIVAIRADDADGPWILRATLSSERLDGLVATDALGRTGEAFLINREGLFQTTPPRGALLERTILPVPADHPGVRDQVVEVDGRPRLVVTTWINGRRWLLVVERSLDEVRAPVLRAIGIGAVVTAAAFVLVVVSIGVATRLLCRLIDRANRQREEMSRAFMRSARLASVGELATGLAHEINNPLAIIAAEQTNIGDVVAAGAGLEGVRGEVLESVARIRRQVERCASITRKMLQFGRARESTLEPTDLGPRLGEIAALLRRQARVSNVDLQLEIEDPLPRVVLDPIELEQVVVNLITNAVQAMTHGGTVWLRARRVEAEVWLEVADNGPGMTTEILERIFEPFFTTKPVGQGTGLGLAVCFGLVTSWGGRIEADSAPGRGTTMRMRLPAADAGDAVERRGAP
jgi:two-component system NtrC family sensor kinase